MNQPPLLESRPAQGIPYIPQHAPFTPDQRAWLNGYLAGMFSRALDDMPGQQATVEEPDTLKPLYILYGSQTGSAEGLAKSMSATAKTRGYQPTVLELNDYQQMNRSEPVTAMILTSTWGDGDPPENAEQFWTDLRDKEATSWDQVSYALLALGDRNYSDFCGAGKRFDERLSALGATRLLPRVDCDVDFEEEAEAWMERIWQTLETQDSESAPATPATETKAAPKPDAQEAPQTYSRKNPFPGTLLKQLPLNREGSEKDTRHVEISIEGSGIQYQTGDALGIFPMNCPEWVDQCLAHCQLDGSIPVQSKDGTEKPLREALQQDCQVTQINQRLLTALTKLPGLEGLPDAEAWQEGMDLLDVLPAGCSIEAQALIDCLPKLQPRLYSIASSPLAHPDAIHLTVGVVRYQLNNRAHQGVCSTFLADRLDEGSHLSVFLHASKFRLPENPDTAVIMVGPGTGIAPFRGFLQERAAIGGSGKNWLFFGDRKADLDFLYQDELKAFQAQGVLHRLDTAFSRDQAQKVYVQDRMQEKAAELWNWLDAGAHFYVCGDAKRMAKDVDSMLHQVIAQQGGMSEEAAQSYVATMKKEKRYLRDVY